MTKLEEIARAICEANGAKADTCVHGFGWAAGEGGNATAGTVCYRYRWQDFLPQARAVLSALKTPTPEMIDAGQAVDGTVSAADVWSAMIGAAGEGR